MPPKTLLKPVPGPPGHPQRRLVAWLDLQPDPGDGEAAVSPRRRGPNGPGCDAAAPLLGPYPVGQLDALRTVGHQPYRAQKLPIAQDAQRELAPGRGIPVR